MFLTMPEQRQLPAEGSPNSRIAIVGDFSSKFDTNAMRPFSGPVGNILEQCLHAADLIRGDCYITNLVKEQPRHVVGKKGNEYISFDGKNRGTLSERGLACAEVLREELNNTESNVIVVCGDAAFLALTGLDRLSRYRGYIFASQGLDRQRKVIGT